MASKTFVANVDKLSEVLAFIETELENHDASVKAMMPISISVEEMFVNVASYAYDGNEGNCDITIEFEDNDSVAAISLMDTGMEFDPVKKIDPDITLSAEERGIGGLGILMVKKYMDEVFYERKDNTNIFTMKKRIKNV